jgi:hypothetical protein
MVVIKFFSDLALIRMSVLFSILTVMNRRRELLRLSQWATRKRLSRPLKLYRFRLSDEEIRLNHYSLRYPRLTTFAYFIHRLNTLLFPPPRYPRRGLAKHYTRRYLIHSKNGV